LSLLTPRIHYSSASIVTKLRTGGLGSILDRDRDSFSLPPCPDRLWNPSSLQSNGNWRLCPGGEAAGAWGWPITFI